MHVSSFKWIEIILISKESIWCRGSQVVKKIDSSNWIKNCESNIVPLSSLLIMCFKDVDPFVKF
jgi:hypothetical protein